VASAQGIRAGRAYVEIATSDNKLVRGLKRASARLKAFGAGVRSIGLRVAGMGAAVTAPLAAMTRQFASAGDDLNKMSLRTGMSTEALSTLGFAAEQSGANLQTLESGVRRMQASIFDAAQGSKTAVDALDALGASVSDLQGLSPEQQFKTLAERLSQVEDPTTKAALAMDLLGRSGQKLIPLLDGGREGIEALQAEARGLNLEISSEDAQSAADLTDAMNRVKQATKAASMQIGAALAGDITKALGAVTKFVVAAVNWVKQNKRLFATIFKIGAVVLAVGAGLLAFGAIVSAIGFALSGLVTVAGFIGTAFSVAGSILAAVFSPIGLIIVGVIAAVVALGAYILFYTEAGGKAVAWLGETFNRLKETALAAWQGIGDALAAGDIALAAKVLWLTLKMEWKRGIHFLNGLWVQAKDFFVGLWSDAVYGVAKLLNDGWAAVEIGWAETVGFLADAWGVFTTMLTKTWHSTVGFLKKAWTRLKGLVDSDIDVEAEIKRINQETDAKQAGADAKLTAAVGQRDKDRRARRAAIERNRAGANATLDEMKAEDEARRQAKYRDELAGTQSDLDEARREWEAAIAEAAAKRAEADAEQGPDETGKPGVPDFTGVGENLTAEQAKVEAKGTFSAAALRGLGADSLAERQLKTQERIADGIDDLVDRAGPLVFAE